MYVGNLADGLIMDITEQMVLHFGVVQYQLMSSVQRGQIMSFK